MKLKNNSLTSVPASLLDGLIEHATQDTSVGDMQMTIDGLSVDTFGDFILEGSSAEFSVEVDAPDYWKLDHIVHTNGAHCGVLAETQFKGHKFILKLEGYPARVEGRKNVENEPIGFTIETRIDDGVASRNKQHVFKQDRPSILRQEYADYKRSGTDELLIPSRNEIRSEDGTWTATHFELWEFTKENNYTDMFIDGGIVAMADSTRKRFGKGVIITSGYRCPQRNKAVKGVPLSKHMTGKAVDLLPEVMGTDRTELRDLYNAAAGTMQGSGKALLERGATQLLPGNQHIPEGTLDKTKTFEFDVVAKQLQKDGENYTLTLISGSTMPSEINQLKCGKKSYKILSADKVPGKYRYEVKFKTADVLKKDMNWSLTGSYADLLKFASHVHIQL